MPKSSNVPHPTDLIKRDQLNYEVLYYIFGAAYRKPRALVVSTGAKEVDSGASIDHIDVVAPKPLGMDYDVEIFERNNVVRFGKSFEFREGLDRSEKLEFLNELNLTKVMARFSMSVDGESLLYVIFDLPIGEGVTPLQILNCATRFEMIIKSLVDHEKVEVPDDDYDSLYGDFDENDIRDWVYSSESSGILDIKEMS